MIKLKTKEDIRVLRQGGKILAAILEKLIAGVRPGVNTEYLEKTANELINKAGGRPSFKGHAMHDALIFPTTLCISINDEVVHTPALPGREIKSGDIVGVDIGMRYPAGESGYYTDMAKTVIAGKGSREAEELVKTTEKALALAIEKVRPGNTLNDIGAAIQDFVEAKGFSVVRELVGHGVGYDVHEEPQVPNFKIKDGDMQNVVLKPGMVIAIEPMVNAGGWKVKTGRDGFAILTADGSLSAHFEHTVAVTDKGHEILTAI